MSSTSHLPLRRCAAAARYAFAPLAALAIAAALASPAAASEVPAAGILKGSLAGSLQAPAAQTGGLQVNPLRVRDPQRYAQQKAAADSRYQRWVATHPASLALSGPLNFAPAVLLNKPGMTFAVDKCTVGGKAVTGCNAPPDTTGAIGPNGYVEFVNSQIAVFNRSTLASPPTATATEDAFVNSTDTCDGQIKWDQTANRWVYWSLDCAASAGHNGFSFGWSKTASPTPFTGTTANWCKFHFNTTSNLEDYGKLGNYNGAWVVGANEFPDAGGENVSVFALPKPAAGSTACPSSEAAKHFHPSSTVNFTPEPANIFGSSTAGFIPARDAFLPSTHLRMLRVTGTTVATYALFQDASITVPSYTLPPNLPQPGGGTNKVDTSDTRLTQAAAAKDPKLAVMGIWTQHTVLGPGNAGSVVRWYELKDGQTTPVQTGTVLPLTTGAFAFNGAISPTTVGNAAAINYNTGSPTVKIQLISRIHASTAVNGATSNQTPLGSSSGIVNDFSCPSHSGTTRPCRWGDYAGASFDPLNNTAVWGTGELVAAPDTTSGIFLARWLTRNFQVTVQ
jgi:hypothetical protein